MQIFMTITAIHQPHCVPQELNIILNHIPSIQGSSSKQPFHQTIYSSLFLPLCFKHIISLCPGVNSVSVTLSCSPLKRIIPTNENSILFPRAHIDHVAYEVSKTIYFFIVFFCKQLNISQRSHRCNWLIFSCRVVKMINRCYYDLMILIHLASQLKV